RSRSGSDEQDSSRFCGRLGRQQARRRMFLDCSDLSAIVVAAGAFWNLQVEPGAWSLEVGAWSLGEKQRGRIDVDAPALLQAPGSSPQAPVPKLQAPAPRLQPNLTRIR